MSYAILGYLMIALIVVLLLTNKATPITAFVIIPPIVALVAGYSIEEVNGFIQAGVSSSMGTALLALLSIIFFSIMTEQGLFDPFVNFLVSKAGNNVAVITVISAIVAHFSHLDTGTTSTLLVTIPSMLPIYRRLGIDRKYLYLVIVQAIGVMNLLPWGGAITRSCAVTGMDPATITVAVAPCLVAGFAYNMVTAWIYGKRAQKKIAAGILDTGEGADSGDVGLVVEENRDTKLNLKYWINLAWTLIIVAMLFLATEISGYITFFIAVVGALVINYRSVKEWNAIIDKYAKNALRTSLVMFAAGFFAGILNNSDMLSNMSNVVTSLIPAGMAPLFAIICGVIAFVFSILLGADGFHYGMMPLLISAGATFGFAPAGLVYVMCMCADVVSQLRPVQATSWMTAGMCGVEFKNGIAMAFPVVLGLFLVEMVVGVLCGVVPIG